MLVYIDLHFWNNGSLCFETVSKRFPLVSLRNLKCLISREKSQPIIGQKSLGRCSIHLGGNFSANHATQWWITSENLRSESILSQRYVRLSMFRLFFNNCLSRYFLEVAKSSTDRCIMVHSIGRVKIDSKS